MKERLPLLELFLSALCLWAAWYHTPAGALVRTAGAFIFGTRSTARPLLAYFGAGTLVPPRPPPPLAGPIPPAQALAYGTAAVLDGSAAELAPRLRMLSQRLGSDDAALLAIFCGEDAARFAVLVGGRRLHAGIDLGASAGTPVRSVAAGVVRRASSDGINGRILVLDHGRGVVTTYCHNDALLVRDGQHVERGQVVARSGSSGLTTGPHLHYQIDLAGEPVDPLRFRAHAPKFAAGATD